VSQSFSYQVTTSNAVTDYAAAGLPDGLSIDPAAGLISGAPTTAGTYTVTLSLTDATGTSTATLTISVAPNFPVVSGMLLWLKADMGVTADSSGNVSQWTDQSGIGNNAFQSIAANQPVLVSNQFNGLPVVRFNGPNSLSLPYNMMQGAQAGEIIVVTKQTDTQDQANVLFDFGTGYGARYYDVYHYDDFGTNDISAIPPESESALQQYHVYNTSITADGTSTYSFNGVPEWTRTGLAVGFSQFPDIGGGFGGSFTGDMVEVILYSRVLSAAERGTIYGYLAQRYAMPSVVNNVNSPAITSASSVTGAVGQTFSFQITASNSPTSFGASGLPPGLSVSSTGLISGTPTTDGDFNASVTATNASGSGSSPLTFTINPAPPVITSATSATGQENQAFSYQIAATNNPTGYSATGLPTGLTVDPVAGLISGTPAVGTAGTFSVYLTATNSAGSGSATLNLAISVAAAVAPVITSATSATSQIELAFSYQITANNNPTSYAATGLPSGLTVDPVAGLISGTPTAAGSSTVTLTATNLAGSGTATLNITITGLTSSTPVITSATSVTGQINEAISYQITASNNPTSYSATGLPSGLTVDPVAGVISGTPTAAGATTVTLNATNSAGSGTATLNLVITTIPIYSTGFEPGDGFVVGALGGQNGWTVSQGTAVITAQVYRSGVQSLELVPGSSAAIAVQTFPAIPNETIEYCDFYAMPAAETQIGSSSIYTVEGAQFGFLQSGVLEAFYGDGNGGGSWVPTQFTVALGSGNETSLSWVRLTARLDFTAQTWDLYANGAMVAAAIPFINNSSIYLSTFQIQGDASSPFYIDDVYVGSMNPMFANISNDGISDAWKAQYGLSLTANDRNGDPTRGGVTNIQKYIAGTNPLDFYNGVAPYVVPLYTDPVSGQGVPGPNDDLAMTVAQFDGTPWPNAPVTFQITSGTRLISLVQGQGPYVSTLNVVTDSTGVARVYLQPLMSQ
jgi:PKD repeat protein